MSRKSKLMERLDKAAEQLLDRSFLPLVVGEPMAPLMEQIRVFDSVVKYYGPRTKLGGDEEENGSEFERLRATLNRRTPSRRRSRPETDNGADPSTDNADGDA